MALKTIQGKRLPPVVIMMIVIVAIGIIWMVWEIVKPTPPPPSVIQQPIKPTGPPPDPLAAYKQALASPAPLATLKALVNQLQTLYSLPGWVVQSIQVTDEGLTVTLMPGDPTITNVSLEQWAKLNHLKIDFQGNSAKLYLPISVPDRPKPTADILQPLLPLVADVQQRLQSVALAQSMTLSAPVAKGNYQQLTITVSFSQVAPDYLVFLGQAIKGLPIVLDKYTVSMSGNLISGSVGLTILGK